MKLEYELETLKNLVQRWKEIISVCSVAEKDLEHIEKLIQKNEKRIDEIIDKNPEILI